MAKLYGKTAIVTGASSGIGAGIAKELANAGVDIAIAGRNTSRLQNIAHDIKEMDRGKVLVVPTDVKNQTDVDALAIHAADHFGKVDILINNAGQMLSGSVQDGQVREWEDMIDVNIKGTLYGINAVLPSMLEAKSGHIINIGSVSGLEVTKNSTVYSATKHAIRTISMGLEKELARTGVRVTNISPGMVDTPLSGETDWGERKKLEPKDIAEAVVYALQQPSHVNVNEITVRPV